MHVRLVDHGSDIGSGAAGETRNVVIELDLSSLQPDDVTVQLVHGPVLGDGSFDEALLHVVATTVDDDGRYRASFVPDRAGRWGVAARAVPSHPSQRGLFDMGLITTG